RHAMAHVCAGRTPRSSALATRQPHRCYRNGGACSRTSCPAINSQGRLGIAAPLRRQEYGADLATPRAGKFEGLVYAPFTLAWEPHTPLYITGCKFSREHVLLSLALMEVQHKGRVWCRQKNAR